MSLVNWSLSALDNLFSPSSFAMNDLEKIEAAKDLAVSLLNTATVADSELPLFSLFGPGSRKNCF